MCGIQNNNSNILLLPDVRIEFQPQHNRHTNIGQELLLVSGGRAPSESWLKQAALGREVWCIDHGIDCCYKAGLLPQRLIGDGDSASPLAWQWAEENNMIIARFPAKKDYTDSQLAFKMAESDGRFVVLTGALGGRFDHAYSTVFSFGFSRLCGCIADDKEAVFFLRQQETITLNFLRLPKAISLLPLTNITEGVSIDGVYWPLHDTALRQSNPYAISNEAVSSKVRCSLSAGVLAVYICWNEK